MSTKLAIYSVIYGIEKKKKKEKETKQTRKEKKKRRKKKSWKRKISKLGVQRFWLIIQNEPLASQRIAERKLWVEILNLFFFARNAFRKFFFFKFSELINSGARFFIGRLDINNFDSKKTKGISVTSRQQTVTGLSTGKSTADD